MTKKYSDIFFDLDRTLWDFNRNSEITLELLFRDYNLQKSFGNFLFFKSRFDYHNAKLWNAYYQNRISKEKLIYHRFYLSLKEAGNDDLELAKIIAQDFLDISPLQTVVFPNTHETLKCLKKKEYQLHIITNGFNEVQYKKLENSNLIDFFTQIITSEDAGANKPSEQIFKYAIEKCQTDYQNCIMIGDDLNTDIKGAQNSNIDQIYFNPKNQKHNAHPTFEVNQLKDIQKLL